MNCKNDNRTVMTLDAGGTNFVFSAVRGCEEVVESITQPSNADNLDKCLKGIIEGFSKVKEQLKESPLAISFAFPGPTDYPNGIVGDLGNLPAFRGGVAIGPMLENIFGIPVFMNNDGDLYAYGEAIVGYLPWVNSLLEKSGSPKRYKNLVGFTLGTGFGGGIVRDGNLFLGDNSGAAEVWIMSNKFDPDNNIEEMISIRAVRREYARIIGIPESEAPTPKDIYDIGTGVKDGNKEAALEAYRLMGIALGDALCNAMTIVDGIAVIGGGLAGAKELFMPAMISEMRSKFNKSGNARLSQKIYNLEDDNDLREFVKGDIREINVPFTDTKIKYDASARLGVGISKIGTSRAISIGAYAYALQKLDEV